MGYWLSYEWSEGGMIHAHIALWIVGSPRFDKTNVPKEKSSGVVVVEPETADVRIHSSEEVAKLMASFSDGSTAVPL